VPVPEPPVPEPGAPPLVPPVPVEPEPPLEGLPGWVDEEGEQTRAPDAGALAGTVETLVMAALEIAGCVWLEEALEEAGSATTQVVAGATALAL
jgi:hypothetical protein